MRRYLAQLKGVAITVSLAMTAAECTGRGRAEVASPAEADVELGRIRQSVEKALTSSPPTGYARIPDGVRLLSVAREKERAIVMDFSTELLAGGTGRVLEDALHQIFAAASAARLALADRVDDYRVLVNGSALETYLR